MTENLTLLECINEDTVLAALKERHAKDAIYTAIGSVIIAVNPYKNMDSLYDEKTMLSYKSRNIYESSPHIFALADNAFHLMKTSCHDQCIIISGESGAGKTEASKIFLKYIARVSNENQSQVAQIKDQLLFANPLLEAFGNAKTSRNDNSSRFGKYMDIQFDFHAVPMGGKINTYLLEKSRVTKIEAGERSFHIFYQLLKGADDKLLESLYLTRNVQEYHYLNQSECQIVDGTDDAKDYTKLMSSFSLMGIKVEQAHFFLQITAAILNLGNVTFESDEDGATTVAMSSRGYLDHAALLLGIDSKNLVAALTMRTIKDKAKQNASQKSSISVTLAPEKAAYTRDALAKAIYNRTFEKLVHKINEQLRSKRNTFLKATSNVIGVLDIYGFESMKTNGFEQFVINYCNEKLQQIFIELVLKQEQEEYTREGIAWTDVTFFNNKTICDLIEGKAGLINIMDEESYMPGNPTDLTFLEKLNASQLVFKHDHYDSKAKSVKARDLSHGMFRLRHYAGNVDYTADGFLSKNKDTFYNDLSECIQGSSIRFVADMFAEKLSDDVKMKRPDSLATQFKLMKNLMSKNPHYIRCIKSNNEKKADFFDSDIVMHQIRFLGLVENIRVRVAGYCFRSSMDSFVARFKMLSKSTWPNPAKGSLARDSVVVIMNDFGINDSNYILGKTKIFIRQPSTLNRLETQRNKFKVHVAIIISKQWRSYIARKKFKRQRALIIKLQACVRRKQAQSYYTKLQRASLIVSKNRRAVLQRRIFKRILFKMPKRAVLFIQRAYRKYRMTKFLNHDLVACVKAAKSWRTVDWPIPSKSRYSRESDVLPMIQSIYASVIAKKFRAGLTIERKAVLAWKAASYDLFRTKQSYQSSFAAPFQKMRIALSPEEIIKLEKALNLKQSQFVSLIPCSKLHRSALNKEVGSALLLTSERLFVLNFAKALTLKDAYSINDVTSVSTSTLSDGVLIIHLAESKKGDLVLRSDAYCIEFLSALYLQRPSICIQMTGKVQVSLKQKKQNIGFIEAGDKYCIKRDSSAEWMISVPKCQGNHKV